MKRFKIIFLILCIFILYNLYEAFSNYRSCKGLIVKPAFSLQYKCIVYLEEQRV